MAERDLPDPMVTAKVQLSELAPENGKDLRAQVDPNKVRHLIRIFRRDGCQDTERINRVRALVRKDELLNVVARSEQINVQFPKLRFGHTISFLNGNHRLAAAAEFLPIKDQWWTVELFDKDTITISQRRQLRKDYANAGPPCDGEVFCDLRQANGTENEYFAEWDSESKTELFRQLTSRNEFGDIKVSLDNIRPFRGHWQDLEFGTARRWLSLWFPEEFCGLLKRTHSVWSDFLGNERYQDLDPFTVRCLEGRSPLHSNEDRWFIAQLMASGRLFPDIPDLQRRGQLLDRILRGPGIIPSLKTNIEDSKFLEPIFLSARPLFEPRKRESTRNAAYRCYKPLPGGQIPLQETDGQITTVTIRGVDKIRQFSFWTAYAQVLLKCFRIFPHTTILKPRKDPKSTAHIQQNSKVLCQMQLAQLALKLGFRSSTICYNAEGKGEDFAAADILLNIKPRDAFKGSFEKEAERIREFFPSISFGDVPSDVPEVTINASETWRLDHRCGRTYDQSFCRDQQFCFFKHIFAPRDICRRERLTSFAVIRLTFNAFLGPVEQFGLTPQALAALFGRPVVEPTGDPLSSDLFSTTSQQPQLLNLANCEVQRPALNNVTTHSQQTYRLPDQLPRESAGVTSQQTGLANRALDYQFQQAEDQIRFETQRPQTPNLYTNADSQQCPAIVTAGAATYNAELIQDQQWTEHPKQQNTDKRFPAIPEEVSHLQGLDEVGASPSKIMPSEDTDTSMYEDGPRTPASLFDFSDDGPYDNGGEITSTELSRGGSVWEQPPDSPQQPDPQQPSTLPQQSNPQQPSISPQQPDPPQPSTSPQQSDPPQPSTSPQQSDYQQPSASPQQPDPPQLTTSPQQSDPQQPSTSPEQSDPPQPSTSPEQSDPPQMSTSPQQSNPPRPSTPPLPPAPPQPLALAQLSTFPQQSFSPQLPPLPKWYTLPQQQALLPQQQASLPQHSTSPHQIRLPRPQSHPSAPQYPANELATSAQEDSDSVKRQQVDSSLNRRRRRSISPEESESRVIDDRRRALWTQGKYRIVEIVPPGDAKKATDIDITRVNTPQTDIPRAGMLNDDTFLWHIKEPLAEVQHLVSSRNIIQGHFIERFGQLRQICRGHMPCCILDKETDEYIFIAQTAMAQANLNNLMLDYAKQHRFIWSVDFEQRRLIASSWDKASKAAPAGQLFIATGRAEQLISNRIEYGPKAVPVLQMPVWDEQEWRVVDTDELPIGFFDL